MVICIWCALFVTSQFDVIFMLPNQRFGKVCWHYVNSWVVWLTRECQAAGSELGGAMGGHSPLEFCLVPPVASPKFSAWRHATALKSYTDHWQLPLLQNWPLQWPPQMKMSGSAPAKRHGVLYGPRRIGKLVILIPKKGDRETGVKHQLLSSASLEKCMLSVLQKVLLNYWIQAGWHPMRFCLGCSITGQITILVYVAKFREILGACQRRWRVFCRHR